MRVEVLSGVERRRQWSDDEKARIVEETLVPGARVAEVARRNAVSASLVFGWRRLARDGVLGRGVPALVPVEIVASAPVLPAPPRPTSSRPKRADRDRAVAGSAPAGGARRRRRRAAARARRLGTPMIPLPSGAKVWLATGHTDMRKGIGGLSLLVQEMLRRDPFCGHLFVFRGRRSDLIKIVWHDGQGGCLFMKKLDRGRFIWPSASDGTVSITTAQLAYLIEGIDWRNPQYTWRPVAAG